MARADSIHLNPRRQTPTPFQVPVPVSFLLSPTEFQVLRRLAVEAKVSRSAFIRQLIQDAAKATP